MKLSQLASIAPAVVFEVPDVTFMAHAYTICRSQSLGRVKQDDAASHGGQEPPVFPSHASSTEQICRGTRV